MSCYKYHFILLTFLIFLPQKEFVAFLPERTIIESKDDKLHIELRFLVKPGFHIQAEDEVPDNIIPTSINFHLPESKHIIKKYFVIKSYDTVIFGENIHKVISSDFTVILEVGIENTPKILKGELSYQACDDRQCFFPRKLPFKLSL
ncbi:hypothetical protein ML462_05315 [Gramella lutea]|uniref:Thiol:disulfide interchange protein DsbD N-terminal domain-containing protein n=1 Tax=Christiangramia lutea TaxID=1607951 RepID=A0A9X1V1P3_9FLAO|nr:hypothetical protein [Christiangramia lutea]MCH4822585.1 hypothetical protein [Christiangramia lutea]